MSKKTDLQTALTEKGIEFPEDATIADLQALLEGPKSIVPKRYKKKYAAHGGSCGDEMAGALKSAVAGEKGKTDVKALESVMAQNGLPKNSWSGLNIGQRRMNLGNVLRSRIKRGEEVTVGTEVWNEGGTEEAAA